MAPSALDAVAWPIHRGTLTGNGAGASRREGSTPNPALLLLVRLRESTWIAAIVESQCQKGASSAASGAGRTVSWVNRRQQQRQDDRRRAHARGSSKGPRNVLTRVSYSPVKKGHVVPQTYQRNFAVDDQVAVHIDGRAKCVRMRVRDAGTRPRFYRRTRPSGVEIDDIEASLSVVEDRITPIFVELLSGADLTLVRKGGLAQFYGLQMVRGPAFLGYRQELIRAMLDQLTPADLKPRALARAHGDAAAVAAKVGEAYLDKTNQLTSMLGLAIKFASILGCMRWQILRLADPVLAYSDHPVVVWPSDVETCTPHPKPRFGAINALEVCAPLSPHLAVLMTWSDGPDATQRVDAARSDAEELNAMVIAQADRQWMHRVDAEPPVARGRLLPLSRRFVTGYTAEHLAQSSRRAAAQRFLQQAMKKPFVDDIDIVFLPDGEALAQLGVR